MSGKRNEYGYPVMKDNDRLLVDNRSKAELLEGAFAKVHSTENYCRNQRKRRNTKETFGGETRRSDKYHVFSSRVKKFINGSKKYDSR